MSTAILKLSENGDLQRIHDKWLLRSACTSQTTKLEVNRLKLKSFSGLYLICGLACFLALAVYFIFVTHQFRQHHTEPGPPSSSTRRSTRSKRLQRFLSFVDEKEDLAKSRSKRRQRQGGSVRIVADEGASVPGSRYTIHSEIVSDQIP